MTFSPEQEDLDVMTERLRDLVMGHQAAPTGQGAANPSTEPFHHQGMPADHGNHQVAGRGRGHGGRGRGYRGRGRGQQSGPFQGQNNGNLQQVRELIQRARARSGAQFNYPPGMRGQFRGSMRGRGGLPQNPTPAALAQYANDPEFVKKQYFFLEQMFGHVLHTLYSSKEEINSKEEFRAMLEGLCRQVFAREYGDYAPHVELVAFGSAASTFALPGSDIDLSLQTSEFLPGMIELLEKTLLANGIGARLLGKTRVPILKICQSPTPELFAALVEAHKRSEGMTTEPDDTNDTDHEPIQANEAADDHSTSGSANEPATNKDVQAHDQAQTSTVNEPVTAQNAQTSVQTSTSTVNEPATSTTADEVGKPAQGVTQPRKHWYRERRPGPLDFPKVGVGIQADINFANNLGIINTQLLRCYARCDPRVTIMVLFVKDWVSRRKINSNYMGTLSSYGYVLMVLHFLVNVADPPVCPNLQLARRPEITPMTPITAAPTDVAALAAHNPAWVCDGCDVRFWDDEAELAQLARDKAITSNRKPVGHLLRDFFMYYACQGKAVPNGGFRWTADVLSLRTPGGLLTKQSKGWTGAQTEIKQDMTEVRNRYLVAIEDPFELGHNVGRTVTHNGIVAIRDEFRRAWRIILLESYGMPNPEGHLLDFVTDMAPERPNVADNVAETGNVAENDNINENQTIAENENQGNEDGATEQ